jgi:hypothetical protein
VVVGEYTRIDCNSVFLHRSDALRAILPDLLFFFVLTKLPVRSLGIAFEKLEDLSDTQHHDRSPTSSRSYAGWRSSFAAVDVANRCSVKSHAASSTRFPRSPRCRRSAARVCRYSGKLSDVEIPPIPCGEASRCRQAHLSRWMSAKRLDHPNRRLCLRHPRLDLSILRAAFRDHWYYPRKLDASIFRVATFLIPTVEKVLSLRAPDLRYFYLLFGSTSV